MAKEDLSSDPECICYLHLLKKKRDPFTCKCPMRFDLTSLIHTGTDNTVRLLFLTAFVWCTLMYSWFVGSGSKSLIQTAASSRSLAFRVQTMVLSGLGDGCGFKR